ncbi:hypothetical protein AN958_00055 [Leucoagaricus sp. SymC.cos]|nr:hypothetical protein AN958_00055 [Leucoagaricus sp. SymC.cos]
MVEGMNCASGLVAVGFQTDRVDTSRLVEEKNNLLSLRLGSILELEGGDDHALENDAQPAAIADRYALQLALGCESLEVAGGRYTIFGVQSHHKDADMGHRKLQTMTDSLEESGYEDTN